MSIFKFYEKAKEYVIKQGYQQEIDYVEKRKFVNINPDQFFYEYVYVVLNAGMKNQVAEKIFSAFTREGVNAIGHLGKRKAVTTAKDNFHAWFAVLSHKETIAEQLEYLKSLPWIGDITKYHLARNIGLDVAKPDRHLVRFAKIFKYDDVQKMCTDISKKTNDRIGTVDVILWRYANLVPSSFERADICENHCVGDNDYYCDPAVCCFTE